MAKIKVKAAEGCMLHDHSSRQSVSNDEVIEVVDCPLWRRRIRKGAAILVEEADEAADTGSKAIEPPTEKEERLNAILDAAEKLTEGEEKHWTKAKYPEVRALGEILGWTPSAAERNEAWDSLEEEENAE